MATCPFCSSSVDALPGRPATCPACGAAFKAGESVPGPAVVPVRAADPEIPCPMCGELIKAGARLCRFCKSPLTAGGSRPAVAAPAYVEPAPKKSHWVLWLVLGLIGFVVLICVGGIVFVVSQKDKVLDLACQAFLTTLHQQAGKIEAEGGGAEVLDGLRGGEFVRHLAREAQNDDMAYCPAGALKQKRIAYRGPMKAWSEIALTDIVMCDHPGIHESGIWVLRRNGTVEMARSGSELYTKALAETQE